MANKIDESFFDPNNVKHDFEKPTEEQIAGDTPEVRAEKTHAFLQVLVNGVFDDELMGDVVMNHLRAHAGPAVPVAREDGTTELVKDLRGGVILVMHQTDTIFLGEDARKLMAERRVSTMVDWAARADLLAWCRRSRFAPGSNAHERMQKVLESPLSDPQSYYCVSLGGGSVTTLVCSVRIPEPEAEAAPVGEMAAIDPHVSGPVDPHAAAPEPTT